MGLWHGIGYCVLTDWHWQVRSALGIHDGDQSYIELLIRVLTGWTAPPSLVQTGAGIVFVVCLLSSVVLNVKDARSASRMVRLTPSG